jgi:hypothetical protein
MAIELTEKLVDRLPFPAGGGKIAVETGGISPHVRLSGVRSGSEGDAVLADDERRDTLSNALFVSWVSEKSQIAVNVCVHEPGAHDFAGRFDGLPRRVFGERADGRDAVAGDADVGPEPREPGAVHDAAVADEVVEHGGPR